MRWQRVNGLWAVLLSAHIAWGADEVAPRLKARPLRIESTANVPTDLKFRFDRLKPGFRVTYLIEGEDLARIQRVNIRSIKTPGGKDLLGSYKEWWDGEISTDGKYYLFPIHLDRSLGGKDAKLQFDGDVELQIGVDRKQIEIELTGADSKPKKLGPFTLIPTPNGMYSPSQGPSSFIQHAPPPPRSPPPPGFDGVQAPKPRILDTTVQSDPRIEYLWTVKVKGPEERWIDIKFADGAKPLTGLPYVSGEYLAFDLPKPSSGRLKVTIDQFNATKSVTVPIESLGNDE